LLAHFARGGRVRAKTEENFLVAAPPSYERPSLTLLDSAKVISASEHLWQETLPASKIPFFVFLILLD
jgi:hypothetical protein